jgi:hypothetical protein
MTPLTIPTNFIPDESEEKLILSEWDLYEEGALSEC